jgi:hydroxyethylthiazole kinase
MLVAAEAAADAGKPWVLDPVAVGATTLRRDAAARLLALGPTLVRGNASEIIALGGTPGREGPGGRGVDATEPVAAAELAAVDLARRQRCVVAVTGEIDFVTDGMRAAHVANGHIMMPQVTALGCALTCVCGAFLATGREPFEDTVAALAYYGLAGEHAARGADGPGSFALCFLDALAGLSADALDADARIAPVPLPGAPGAPQRPRQTPMRRSRPHEAPAGPVRLPGDGPRPVRGTRHRRDRPRRRGGRRHHRAAARQGRAG